MSLAHWQYFFDFGTPSSGSPSAASSWHIYGLSGVWGPVGVAATSTGAAAGAAGGRLLITVHGLTVTNEPRR